MERLDKIFLKSFLWKIKLSPDSDAYKYYNSTKLFIDGYFSIIVNGFKLSEKYYTNLDPTGYKIRRVYRGVNNRSNYWERSLHYFSFVDFVHSYFARKKGEPDYSKCKPSYWKDQPG